MSHQSQWIRGATARRLAAWADANWLRETLWRRFYDWLARRLPDDFSVMNYGYATADAAAADEALAEAGTHRGDAYGLRLYDEVLAGRSLCGKRVLEIGCGRAGGLAHLHRRHGPQSSTGIDFSHEAVALARRLTAGVDGLRVQVGTADALPCGGGTFDAVINVESSHCYRSRERFFGEVARVLAPGGLFFFADLFPATDLAGVHRALANASLQLVEEHDITAGVMRAMQLDEGRRLALIAAGLAPLSRHLPGGLLRGALRAFAGTTDSPMYRSFVEGRRRYCRFVLERPIAAMA